VTIAISPELVTVNGPRGELQERIHRDITVAQEGEEVLVTRPTDRGEHRALHGLTRSLVANMVEGVTNGYRKGLEIQGVGYKAEMKGKKLVLSVGYANQISLEVPPNVTVALDGLTKINVSGADKQAVGEFAARIRKVRKPEPYKGKGIRYEGEVVKTKPGKAFAGAGAK
jgi:large subunit ribosomal protein L6